MLQGCHSNYTRTNSKIVGSVALYSKHIAIAVLFTNVNLVFDALAKLTINFKTANVRPRVQMGLSADFWVELAGMAIVFGLVIVAIPKYRAYKVNTALAHRLRVEISNNIKFVLPNIADTSVQRINADGQLANDSTALKIGLHQLDAVMGRAEVLYSEERERVARFRNGFHALIARYDAGELLSDMTEDLILLGERIVLDLKENGLLSTIGR